MAKPIIIRKDEKDSIFQLKKIERKKLYGFRKRLAVDENNDECKRASLTEDGQVLIKSGMTSQGWFIEGGKQIESTKWKNISSPNNEAGFYYPIMNDRLLWRYVQTAHDMA